MAGASHTTRILCLTFVLIGFTNFVACFGPAYSRIHLNDWSRQSEPVTCPEAKGQFDHPHYCDLFLNCWDGRATVGSCGGGLVFNEKIRACDYPRNVDCKGRGNYQAPPPPDSRCKEPYGTYPNPNNCSEYFVCHAGKATVLSCPENTYYDPALGVCSHDMDPSCINLDPCMDPHAPGCPPIPAGSPTQAPAPTVPLKPKPSFSPDTDPQPPDPSQPQFQPTNETPNEPATVPLKPKPPLKPQNPTPSTPQTPTIPPEISEVNPEEPPSPDPPPPLKPGGLKPVNPGGPPNLNPSTPAPVDGEDDPHVLFPFLPAFPSSFKCPIQNEVFPVLGRCEMLLACVNGEAHLLECPKGSGFDLKRRKCLVAKNANCAAKREPSKVLYVSVPSHQLMEGLAVAN